MKVGEHKVPDKEVAIINQEQFDTVREVNTVLFVSRFNVDFLKEWIALVEASGGKEVKITATRHEFALAGALFAETIPGEYVGIIGLKD